MYLKQTSYTSFDGTNKFISKSAKKDLDYILQRMNSETTITRQNEALVSESTKRLYLEHKNTMFIDKRQFVKRLPKQRQDEKQSKLLIDSMQLVIDNKTGKIIEFTKPFYRTLSSLIKKGEVALKTFRTFYDCEDVVTKKRSSTTIF